MKQLKEASIKLSYKITVILAIIVLGLGISPSFVKAAERNVVKVGYPIVPGFTEIEDGVYKGYAYEYLMEIARYTGWEYEFIEMSLNDLMYKLRDGEIDLAAGMLKNEMSEEMYDFPEESAGYTYTTISTLADSDEISRAEYKTFEGIKVGYYETSKMRLNSFIKFCEDNMITDVELVPYPYDERLILVEALQNKEVDAIISGDLLAEEGQKVVAKFGAMPYYFATTKGNKDILSGLNKALFKIKEDDSNFDQELYNKYFKNHSDGVVHLTADEEDYINHMTPLKAVYVDNLEPLQDYNPETKKAEGVFVDIMKLIARRTGLHYELVRANNYTEAYEMIKNKEADILISTPDNYVKAKEYDITLTEVHFKAKMAKVYDANNPIPEDKPIIAIPKGYWFEQFEGEYELQYYDTVKECIDAVSQGKANYTYGNSYTIAHYVSNGYYPNLSILYQQQSTKVSLGLSKPTNSLLLNIINKAVSSLSEYDIENIMFFNTLTVSKPITLKQFFLSHIVLCSSVMIGFAILVLIVIRIRYKRVAEDKLLLVQKSQNDELTGVYNRATGIEQITKYLEKKEADEYNALIIADIDDFKQVNERLGYQAGDELLIELGQVLKSILTQQDIIFRSGSDEFIIFMKNLDPSNLELVNKTLYEINQVMDKEVSYSGNKQKISLSMGVAISNQLDHFNDFYHEAEQMLDEMKQSGKNGFKTKEIFT